MQFKKLFLTLKKGEKNAIEKYRGKKLTWEKSNEKFKQLFFSPLKPIPPFYVAHSYVWQEWLWQ